MDLDTSAFGSGLFATSSANGSASHTPRVTKDDAAVLELLLAECIDEVCLRVSGASRADFFGEAVDVADLKPQQAAPAPAPAPPQTLQVPSKDDYVCSVCHKSAHCHICNLSFSSDVQHAEHDQGRKHKQMVQQRIEQGCTVIPPVERPFVCTVCRRNFYCEVCRKPFCSQMQMEDHLRGRKHKKLVAKLVAAGMPVPPGSEPLEDGQTLPASLATPQLQQQAREAAAATAAAAAPKPARPLPVPADSPYRAALLAGGGQAADEVAEDDPSLYCEVCVAQLTSPKQKEEHDRGRKHIYLVEQNRQRQNQQNQQYQQQLFMQQQMYNQQLLELQYYLQQQQQQQEQQAPPVFFGRDPTNAPGYSPFMFFPQQYPTVLPDSFNPVAPHPQPSPSQGSPFFPAGTAGGD